MAPRAASHLLLLLPGLITLTVGLSTLGRSAGWGWYMIVGGALLCVIGVVQYLRAGGRGPGRGGPEPLRSRTHPPDSPGRGHGRDVP